MGEPPLAVDPRRWGSLLGVAGGLVFVLSYAPALGTAVTASAVVLAAALALTALHGHYVRPRALGPLARPAPGALAVYGAAVAGELALIAAGSRALEAAGREGLRPALVAAVVGLHFVPFAWAFGERFFLLLGALLVPLGLAGLALGALDVDRAPEASAVLAGLALLGVVAGYAQGRFSRP